VDVLGAQQVGVVAGRDDRLAALLRRRRLQQLDHLDLERLGPRASLGCHVLVLRGKWLRDTPGRAGRPAATQIPYWCLRLKVVLWTHLSGMQMRDRPY